jgi:hypothetical protein
MQSIYHTLCMVDYEQLIFNYTEVINTYNEGVFQIRSTAKIFFSTLLPEILT